MLQTCFQQGLCRAQRLMEEAGRIRVKGRNALATESDRIERVTGEPSRRLFLRGSLMVGLPLMITLKSRTVLGDTQNGSGNLSGCSGTTQSRDPEPRTVDDETEAGSKKRGKPRKK